MTKQLLVKTFYWKQDITLNTSNVFRSSVQQFLKESDCEKLVLSLKTVEYINSSGLGTIADSVMQARKQGKELVVADIHDSIFEIFNIVKFGSFIHLFASENEAIHFLMNHQKEK